MDADIHASWVCGIWCGVAERLVAERVAVEPPLTDPQRDQIVRLVRNAVKASPYLREPAQGVLAVLDAGRAKLEEST